ncbi:MAG: polymer-forming cytoskeletal protein [Deltaproteobacteria bacterium]|nr:polymer-forming cytoskeletal protein [Deltaproteobacteria bacterium]
MVKEAASGTTSLVSRQIVVEGEISGEENLHVDGRVKGSIRLAGDLFVGANGVVEAEVEARNIVIQGVLTGKVLARVQLEVQTAGCFNGESTAGSYEIRDGAVFEGISKMLNRSRRPGKLQPIVSPPETQK